MFRVHTINFDGTEYIARTAFPTKAEAQKLADQMFQITGRRSWVDNHPQ